MKVNTSRMWRSGIAMLLALCLVVGFFPVAAFANESSGADPGVPGPEAKKPLVYVSIGDSMTNGYGLPGYDGESGIVNYGTDVYANQFAAWLAGYIGEIADDQVIFKGSKGIVDHRQLAMSGLLAEDLHWLLELDYTNQTVIDGIQHIWDGPSWTDGPHHAWYATSEADREIQCVDGKNGRCDFCTTNGKCCPPMGFTSGFYRTYGDLCKPYFRLADGAARVLATYMHESGNGYGYFTSTQVGSADIQGVVDGLRADKKFPAENDSHYVTMGGKYHFLQIAGEFYQESVKDADIISLALGNTNFGTLMFDFIQDAIANPNDTGFTRRYFFSDIYDHMMDAEYYTPELKAEIEELTGLIDKIIEQNFDANMFEPQAMETIKYIVRYCTLSYLVNYIAVIEEILAANPDAEIIQVALMNAYEGANTGADDGSITMAEMIDLLYDPINAFISAVPTYMQSNNKYPNAKFYYADMGVVETLTDVFGNDYYTYGNEAITYSEYKELVKSVDFDSAKLGHNASTIRSRFAHWIAGESPRYGWQYLSDIYLNIEFVEHPNKDNWGWLDVTSYGELWKYLLGPMECSWVTNEEYDQYQNGQLQREKIFGKYRGMVITEAEVREFERLSAEEKWGRLNSTDEDVKNKAFSCAMYTCFENAIIRAGQQQFSMNSLSNFSGFNEKAFLNAQKLMAEKLGVDSVRSNIEITSLEQFAEILNTISDALLEDPTASVMMCLANRMEIGSGIGGHPSQGGHDSMSTVIIDTYKTGYTSNEHTEKNLPETLMNLLKMMGYEKLAESIGAAQGFTGDVDDLAIIMAALKMKQADNPALAGVDLDAVEARIRDLSKQFHEDLAYEDQVFLLESGNVLMDYIQNIASEATAIKYEPTEDSFYVSLGDSNVNGYGLTGYVENDKHGVKQLVEGSAPVMLAKKLYGDDWKEHFGQYAQGALRSEDLLYILGVDEGIELDAYYDAEIKPNLLNGTIEATREEYIAAIKKADLISLAVGGGNVTTFTGEQVDRALAGETLVEMDWKKIGVEDEAIAELDALLDEMVPMMDAMGLMDKYLPEGMEEPACGTAKFARVLAESMLYGYASYNYYYSQVLARIREINPDAQLLILGMFNPVDDWTMEMDGEIVPIGGAINNVMMAANLENLAYALQHDNTSYVDLSETVTFLDEAYAGEEIPFNVYYESILKGDGLEVHASANGHVYMYEQMYAVLEEDFEDKKEENLKEAFDAFAPIIKEAILRYGPDVAEEVWRQWNEYGYVAMVEETIKELEDVLKIRYDLTVKETIPAIEEAIDALSAEKDILVKELDALNAQLAAKKAQLEAVINGIEINIHNPEINIDAIGGNAQTEVPAYDCEVEGEGIVAELEAAIRDLEHAIAVIEALIADVEADLADMAKLASQIADAAKELNKTYNDIKAAADDLYDAFKAIEEILTNDADQTIDAVAAAYDAARKTAMAAIDVLEIAMDAASEIDDDILKMVDIIVEDAEALYEKFITELPGCIDKIPPEIMFGSAFLLNEAIIYAHEELPGKIEELKAETRKEIEALIEEYKPQIEQAEKDLEAKWESEIKPAIEAKYAELKAEIEAEYAAQVEALEAKKAQLIAELIAAEVELKNTAANAVAPLLAQIERLQKDIATVNADLACAAEHLDTALKLAYEEAKIAVMALYNEAMAELHKAIEALKAQLEKAIEDLNKALQDMIEDALGDLLDEVKKTVEELKNALIAMGIETLEELVDALVALFNELLYKATHADLVIDEDFKYVALGDGTAAADSYAEALKAYLAAEAAANGIKAIDFVNAAKAGNTVAAEAANLSAEIADADLITLGFSQADMLANAITAGELDWAALVGAEAVPYIEEALAKVTAEIDALELPSEELKVMLNAIVEAYAYNAVEYTINLPALLQAIREVNEDAVVIVVGMYNPIDGISVLGQDLSAFTEYFDYIVEAAGAYGIGLAMLTNELDYVAAPEVEIEKAELSLKDLGALLEGDLSAMYPSANGDAYIAERIENALTLSFEVGGLWGDADDDGVVTPIDAMLVLQYYVGDIDATELNVKVSDVDGDSAVSPIDAMLILQYYVGDIAKFPVEG